MRILALILFLFSTPAMAFEVGDSIKINQYCMTVADFEAYMLRGQPNPIPDDVDCYSTEHIMFLGTVIRSVKDFEDKGRVLSLFEIGELAVIMENGFLQMLSGTIFVPGLKDGKDA